MLGLDHGIGDSVARNIIFRDHATFHKGMTGLITPSPIVTLKIFSTIIKISIL